MCSRIGKSQTIIQCSRCNCTSALIDSFLSLNNSFKFQINPEHVVLAQTPMRTLTKYHNKHVLVSGQGPTEEIARMYITNRFVLYFILFVCFN